MSLLQLAYAGGEDYQQLVLTTEQIYRAMAQLEECYTTHQFRCSTWIPHLSVWVPSWDVLDRNPGGLLTPSIPSLLQGGWSLLSNLEDCSPMSLLFILPDTVCRVWWHMLPVFPPKILVGKRPNCRWAGRSMCWWVGGDLVWRHASQFLYFLRYLSVDLWPQCTSLLRSLCLSSTFFPPNCSPCFLFPSPFILM